MDAYHIPADISRKDRLDHPIIETACHEGGVGGRINDTKSQWFRIADLWKKVRRVDTGQTGDPGRSRKVIGGGERPCVWFLMRNLGIIGKVNEEPWSTTARRERCASSEQRFLQANAVRHKAFRRCKHGGHVSWSTPSFKTQDRCQIPLGQERSFQGAEMKETCCKARKVWMREVNVEHLFEGPLEGRAVIDNSPRRE